MKREGTFGLETSKGLVSKALLAVLGFVGTIIFARVLGPEAYGAFYVVLAAANVIDNPITGVAVACKKRISEGNVNSAEVLGAGLLATITLGGGIFLFVILVGPYTGLVEVENGYLYTGILFLGLISFKILQPMVAGTGVFGTAVFLDTLRSGFTLPLQLALVFLGWGVAGMVYGLSLASFLTAPLALYALGIRPVLPSRTIIRNLWSYAKFSIPDQFFGSAYNRLDILLLGTLIGSSASGQYRVAMQLVLPGIFLSSVMSSGLFAEVSSLVSSGEDAERRVTNNLAFASLFSIPIFFGSLAMPESIVVTIFGPEYRSAATLLMGLAIFQILKTQTSQLTSVMKGQDRPNLHLYITVATLIINVPLGVMLIYQIGTIGVVIATVVAESAKYLLLTYYARQKTKFKSIPGPLRYQFLAGAGMFLVVELIHQLRGVDSWFELLAIVGTGAIVYGISLILISDVFMLTARSIFNDIRQQYW